MRSHPLPEEYFTKQLPVCSVHGKTCPGVILHTHDTAKPPRVYTCADGCKLSTCEDRRATKELME